MSEFANVSTGSFIGDGNLDVSLSSENIHESFSCIWGPDIGFYLLILSIVILLVLLIFNLRKRVDKNENK
jgi:hypothetical protein